MTLEEKTQEKTKRVKEKLDKNNILITSIISYCHENALMRDGKSSTNILVTRIKEPLLGKTFTVFSNIETLEMLYIQTGLMRLMEVKDFLNLENNIY